MVFMEWSEELEFGFKEIDSQHKNLVEIINRAHEIDFKKDKEKGKEILNELVEFVRVHFSTEEKYFKEFGYPGAEEHMAEHEKLTMKVLEFKDKFDKGECECQDILKFLKSWIGEHLVEMDKKYVDFFKEKGLK